MVVGLLLLAMFWTGWGACSSKASSELELRDERIAGLQRDLAIAKAGWAREVQAHRAYARLAHTADAERARQDRLGADPGLDDLEFADRVLFGDPGPGAGTDPAAPPGAPPDRA